MNANENRKPQTPKVIMKQKLLGADEVEKILKRKMTENFGQVRLAFRSYDSDHSGSIGPEEFRRLIARYALYMEDQEFDRLFRRFDPDGGGEIDYEVSSVA